MSQSDHATKFAEQIAATAIRVVRKKGWTAVPAAILPIIAPVVEERDALEQRLLEIRDAILAYCDYEEGAASAGMDYEIQRIRRLSQASGEQEGEPDLANNPDGYDDR